MPDITLAHMDLNLLTALNALLEEGSVVGAAERMHLSQPAMSRTLTRIREATGDPILVRSGRHMVPTPFAQGVREQIHLLLQQARGVLTPKHALDLHTLKRTFSIRCHDAIAAAVTGSLLASVYAEAPHVRLRVLPEHSGDSEQLRQGQLDLEVGSALPPSAELVAETVYLDELAVAVRQQHAWCDGELTAARFAGGQHVIVSRRGKLRDPIDLSLEALGLRRQVVAALPSSTAAMAVVQASDHSVLLPRKMCRALAASLHLQLLPIPTELKLSPVSLVMTWHQRQDHDAAHQWMRTLLRKCISSVVGSEPTEGEARVKTDR